MEAQNISETLEEGPMDYKAVQETLEEGPMDYKAVQSQNPDGKTLDEVSVLSSFSESYAPSEFVTDIPLGDGGESFNVHKKLANGDGTVELMAVGFEQKLVGFEQKLEGVESEKTLANVGDKTDLEGVGTEQRLLNGEEGVENEKKLENEDYYDGLQGFEVDNELGDVDDGIDIEALGLDDGDVSFENLMEGGTLEHATQLSGSIIPDTNKINDGELLVANLGAEFNDSQVNRVEKVVMGGAMEMVDTSNVLTDSPRKIDVAGDGISLTVDVFGPLNGTYPVHNSISGCLLSVKNPSAVGFNGTIAEGDASDSRQHSFTVGDLVWVKIKTDLWWPGMIYDPPATKDAGKCDQRNCFFVKYFGNTNSVWCQLFQLKPFLEFFEPMSCQNKSKSFYGAIEKALGEFGRRVKQKMTCSCFSKEHQVAAQYFPSKDGRHGHSVFSASQFEPANFLKFIRLRALDLCNPGSIEFTVTEGCLSAFYCSIGHKQLPLYKLRPTSNAKDSVLNSGDSVLKSCKSDFDDNKMSEVVKSGSLYSPRGAGNTISEFANENPGEISEKGFESRERKKSKYLSYPYVNSWGRKKGDDESDDHEEAFEGVKSSSSPSTVSTPIGNCNNKNSLKKSRKPVTVNDISHNAEIIAASSAEMLQELRLTALDCFIPSEDASSIPIQEFYLSFRIFRNHGVEVEMDEYKEATLGFQDTYESSLGANTSGNCFASGGSNLQVTGQRPPSAFPKKRGRKKREDINATVAVVHNEIGVSGELPDLNGNNASLSVENMQVVGPAPTLGKLEPKRRKRKMDESVPEISVPDVSNSNTQFDPLLQSVHATSPFTPLGGLQPDNSIGVQGANSFPNAEFLAGQPNANESAEGKKRKRKENASTILDNSSALPDLNGHVTEPNLKGKESTELSSVTTQGKPKRRRCRTTKSVIGIGNPNGDCNNTILLNFGSGSSVPSKEYIIATFSRFGSLVESKTQFLSDSTVQVVFVKDSDAVEALQSLHGRNPFGPSLASYRLQHVATSNDTQASHSVLSPEILKAPATLSGAAPSNSEGPDLVVIKQNLEAMTTMLEKAGDNLSPEMRAKLESEVKGFLKKVSSMVGSSSS